jgi:hypothetical protein
MYISIEYAIIFTVIGFVAFSWDLFTKSPETSNVMFVLYGASLIYTIFNYGFVYGIVTGIELFIGSFLSYVFLYHNR